MKGKKVGFSKVLVEAQRERAFCAIGLNPPHLPTVVFLPIVHDPVWN